MTKVRGLLALVAMVGLCWAASGCKNSCDDLEEECDACTDGNRATSCKSQLASCRAIPDVPGAMSESDCCDIYIDNYGSC